MSGMGDDDDTGRRYAAWFHDLDAWTEYWDIYHPESSGRYYFGDGIAEPGLLSVFLPRSGATAAFTAWKRMAMRSGTVAEFRETVNRPVVASAVMEVDGLVSRLFAQHFGRASDEAVQRDYLRAVHRFAIDDLPAAIERDARIADDDPRKATAGRHTLDGDIMWFAWALHTEAAVEVSGVRDDEHPRRALMLAGVASGCPANFAWRGHRRTRSEYIPGDSTAALLQERGQRWANDFQAACSEIHALFRIRELGHDDDEGLRKSCEGE